MSLKYVKKRSARLLSTIHGFVAWCYDKKETKSMLGKRRNFKFYGRVSCRIRGRMDLH